VRWSVGVEAEGDQILTREQIVELADAVADSDGIASGIGSARFGARLIVEAGSRDEAIGKATAKFRAAARTAGLPDAPVVRAEAISEAEEEAAEAGEGEAEAAEAGTGEAGEGAGEADGDNHIGPERGGPP
jgi:hypothetical protein